MKIRYIYFNLTLLILLLVQCGADDAGGDVNNNSPNSNDNSAVTLTANDITISEGDASKNVVVDFILSKTTSQDVTFTIQTKDGTTTAGVDYEAVNKPITIKAGEISISQPIQILGDTDRESDEQFSIIISNIQGATHNEKEILITLTNDDNVSVNPVTGTSDVSIPATGYTTPTTYSNMNLTWSDEFNGSEINSSNWKFEIGTGDNGWGNQELQYYRQENAYIKDGNLVIEAKSENFRGRDYTSSRMISEDKFDFKYGRVDIRAALPSGQGIWPALWMLGANFRTVGWPSCGEIDIMEFVGKKPREILGTIHWSNPQGNHVCTCDQGIYNSNEDNIFTKKYHVYSIIWDKNQIRWYIDDKQYQVVNTTNSDMTEFHNNFFFILNIAVGGTLPGNPDGTSTYPQFMIVDYIRVFQDK